MCMGGGRQDLRLRGIATRGGGGSCTLTGKSTRSHWTTIGPEAEGMVICCPAGMRQQGSILSSSANIRVLSCEREPGMYRALREGVGGVAEEAVMASRRVMLALLMVSEKRQSVAMVSMSGASVRMERRPLDRVAGWYPGWG